MVNDSSRLRLVSGMPIHGAVATRPPRDQHLLGPSGLSSRAHCVWSPSGPQLSCRPDWGDQLLRRCCNTCSGESFTWTWAFWRSPRPRLSRPVGVGYRCQLAGGPKHRGDQYDSRGVKITVGSNRGWTERFAMIVAHLASWWGACVVIVVIFGILLYRLLAERERRKTLEVTYLYAPANTVVVQEEGPGGPPMWIRVGDGPRPEPSAVFIRVQTAQSQVRSWRRRGR